MRITNRDLDAVFARLVRSATSAGKDPSRWAFGQHTGLAYYVASVDRENGACSQVSPLWVTRKEAWYGMEAMCRAYEA